MNETLDGARDPHPKLVWLMCLANMTYGFGYALVLVAVPQLLAARGVPEPEIAALTALAMTAALGTFLVSPLLDTLVSRRAWSVLLALGATALTAGLPFIPASGPYFAPLLALDALAISLFSSALGGWLGAALPKGCDKTVGTWFTIGNSTGFGIGALTQFWLLTHLSAGAGAAVLGAMMLAPLVLLPLVPIPASDKLGVHESFRALGRDVVQLLRQGPVLRILLLFLLPCAAFTLTNAFGGLGDDFEASAGLVDLSNGIGATVVGFVASIGARAALNRVSAPAMYLLVGALGAVFTLALMAFPHAPAVFVVAVLGENALQSFAQVSQYAIIFRSIPSGSPTASSQFGLLGTAAVVPYAYMQALDGYGYKLAGGVSGEFLMDAALSLAACLAVAVPVRRWLRAGTLEAVS